MEAKLSVVGGKASKAEVALKLPTIIGRSRGAGLTVAHPMISRQHCEVFEANGLLMIRDLGSLNGTSVGGQKIKEAPLPPDAQFTVGPLTFRVVYEYDGDLSELPDAVLAEKKAAAAEMPDFQSLDEPTSFEPDSVGVAAAKAPQEASFFDDLMGESESAPVEESLFEPAEAIEAPAAEEVEEAVEDSFVEPEAEPEPTPPPTLAAPAPAAAPVEPSVETIEAVEEPVAAQQEPVAVEDDIVVVPEEPIAVQEASAVEEEPVAVQEAPAVEEKPATVEETTGEPEFDFFAEEESPASEGSPEEFSLETSEESDLYGIAEPTPAATAPAVEAQESEAETVEESSEEAVEDEEEEDAAPAKSKAAPKKKSWFGGMFGGSKKKGKEKPAKPAAKAAAKNAPAKPAKSEPVEEEPVEEESAAAAPAAKEEPAGDSAIFGHAEEKPAAKKSADPAEPEDVFDDFLKGLG